MTAKHTQGELRYEPGADGYRRGLEDDAVLICGQMVFGVIYADGCGEFKTAQERAARLALCWNMHDRLVAELRGLLSAVEDQEKLSGFADRGNRSRCRALLADIDGGRK